MALKKWHCTRCEEDFTISADMRCGDGRKHEVPAKTYYAASPNLRKYVTEERSIPGPNGKARLVPAKYVEFVRGTYSTSDPEDQAALDIEPGLINNDEWKQKYIGKEDLLEMRERELKAKEERLAKMENDLLVKTQKQVEGEGKSKAGK